MSPALSRGASVTDEGGVRFAVWAPRARSIVLRLQGANDTREVPLQRADDGEHAAHVPHARAGDDYTYVLDGERERADPVSRHQPRGVHGPSRVVDPGAFRWSDTSWPGVDRADLVIYELHVGTFTRSGSFDAAIERLAALRELGITAVELMPVAEFPGTRNWGYDGVFPYAPQSSYGGPEGLRRLVDAAHHAGLAVLLDVVYNHLGPEGNVLPDFGPYFTERHATPWGGALDFDGPRSREIRRYFIENALHWIDEYHLDGLRLDAVHEIHDASRPSILTEIAAAAHAVGERQGRRVHVIAESDANDPGLVRPTSRGGHGLDGVWSDDFHHALHAVLTGERDGYYADFGSLADLGKALRDRFVYDGRHSTYRGGPRGAPAGDVPERAIVVFAQNHDQVGNRARGERLTALAPPARMRLAAALVLLSPYVPLLFMGEEYGEARPFPYFVDHKDPGLLEAVRTGRQREFAAFAWQGEVPDPGAERTFLGAKLDWESREREPHARVLALYRDLLRLRRAEPALGGATPEVGVDEAAGRITALYRGPARAPDVWVVFQIGAADARIAPPGRPGEAWQLRLSTDDPAYGGQGRRAAAGEAERLVVPGETAAVWVGA